jgi:hypothetical protein
MRFKELTYSYTFHVGDWQSEKISSTIELEAGEDEAECLAKARDFVHSQSKFSQVEAQAKKLRNIQKVESSALTETLKQATQNALKNKKKAKNQETGINS